MRYGKNGPRRVSIRADVVASCNFPDRFFAHQGIGNQARVVVDANSLAEGQWNIVPGLADSSGISFESVEYPGYFLRHYAYVLYLNPYDGNGYIQAGCDVPC